MTPSFHNQERGREQPQASSPREIDLHIEELVLHGFATATQGPLVEALQRKLHARLGTHGVPTAWRTSPDHLGAVVVQGSAASQPALLGEQIARAALEGNAQ